MTFIISHPARRDGELTGRLTGPNREQQAFQKYHNTTIVCPPKFCRNVSIFSWDLQWSQETIKAILMLLGDKQRVLWCF